MLFRYSFPMPLHGEFVSVNRYVESEHNPKKEELIHMFNMLLQSQEANAKDKPEESIAWQNVRESRACLHALENMVDSEMPVLPTPNGSNRATTLCYTRMNLNRINVKLINPLQLINDHLKLVK